MAKRFVDAFAPHAAASPNMTILLDAGHVYAAAASALTEVAQQTTSTITAPVTHPRIDRIVVDAGTGVYQIVAGTEATSPAAPAIPAGKIPVCQALLQTTSTTITNSMLTDERALWMTPVTPRNLGEMQAQWVMGAIVVNGTFYFSYKTRYAGTITALDTISGAGTFTVAVKINGTNVTGLSAVSVTSSPATTSASGANAFAAGDTITGVVSSAASSPTNAVLNLNVTWS
ncbi:MAG: hypothetical protein V4564_07745 [Pseudomonadota bacterium]